MLGGVLLAVFLMAQACMATSAGSGDGEAADGSSGSPSAPADPASASPGSASSTPPDSGDPEGGVPEAGASNQPAEGKDGGAPPGPECTDEEMRVVARAERTEFDPEVDQVRFTIVIGNDSGRTCSRDIGGALRELYLIKGTGADKAWSSRHCGAPEGNSQEELSPDFETSHWLVWNGRDSSSCDGDDTVPPGDYRLIARLGTVYSEPVEITLH